MSAYYNELDPYPAQWLRNLIAAKLIADGEVDERSITDVQPNDVRGFTQCHFFAGIGGWSYALRLAGWADDRPVWTGSCPCQPFSAAGKNAGVLDERHLWPTFRRLIAECRPATCFGEQVASAAGREWLSGVRLDLEALGYGVGAADLCAAGVGAPHIRQRIYWLADSGYSECERRDTLRQTDGTVAGEAQTSEGIEADRLRARLYAPTDSAGSGMGDTDDKGLQIGRSGFEKQHVPSGRQDEKRFTGLSSNAGAWADAVWIPCADGKARRIEPGIEPLVNGISNRVGRLCAFGNAIVPQAAAEFVSAFMECMP